MKGTRLAAGVAFVAAMVALPACGGGSDQAGTVSKTRGTGSAPDITLRAQTHHPRAGAPWPIVIRAHDPAGRPLAAEVRYQYLFGGAVVARRSHYRFRGTFHDTFRWPARSLGVPLTFRAVVTTRFGTRRLDYDVQVRR
ncbi:MAG TPA: hypothetical protein VFS64_02605 [Solirubrobacterales bacterium]|nr:hypothetical protein [Solirubrobacterales bacterium]